MSDDFYRAFEEKFRGSRELIKSRLQSYLPFVKPLAELDRGAQTIDLGCGRGEWLELMTEIGFMPYGIDLDEGVVNECLKRNLSSEKGDAVAYLTTIPSGSQAVVSAFHFIEHISFEQLRTVVSEAIRVLKPGGILIMETPNPENIVVSTQNFYLDPTHQRQIPPQLLSFLPQYYGFARIKTVRLQESEDVMHNLSLTLRNVLEGVSPDYAVIAQKAASETIFQALDVAFAVDYGLNLETLASRYHAQLETKAQEADNKAVRAVIKAEQAEAKAIQAVTKAEQAEAKAIQAVTRSEELEAKIQQAEQTAAKAKQAEQALRTVYASRSWRITAPLRWFGLQMGLLQSHGLCARVKVLVTKLGKFMAQLLFSYISARPRLHFKCIHTAEKLGLYGPLCSIYRNLTAMNPTSNEAPFRASLAHLTPRARKICADLKAAIEKNREGF